MSSAFNPMPFVHLHAPSATPQPSDLCFAIQADRLLASADVAALVTLPDFAVIARWQVRAGKPLHVGTIDGRSCWLCPIDDDNASAPGGWQWHETRALLSVLTADQSHAISCARQLAWWAGRHRFCGVCATPTVETAEERAQRCPQCQAVFFPVVSPAVIIAVTRGDEILLAHNRNFRAGMFSLLAGFVDPGETLEQAAVREIREEVGIAIDELRYVASQPWSFPNSLMIGFRARHVGGEITVDRKEIEQAAWFKRGELPDIPRPGTVARRMIDEWLRSERL